MEYVKKYLNNPLFYGVIILLLLFTNIGSIVYFLMQDKENFEEPIICEECPVCEEVTVVEEEEVIPTIKVDIKGYVKNPGVYEIQEGAIVNDLIGMAGGIKSGGTTDNINLSKKLNNEDMIVVLSKTELKKKEILTISTQSSGIVSSSQNQSGTTNTSVENKKVSLNTATKAELMTISGIGEAKADSIIEYRSKTAFTSIEDVMKVSGIGEALYEKIKDFITI